MKAILAGTAETGLGRREGVTLFVDGGKIADVVAGLDPRGADEVIDASKLVVTPGLIDAHTHIGTYCEGFPAEMEDANDMVNPVAPQLRILDAIYQDDTAVADALAGGVTCVQTLPGSGNVIGGQGAVIKTVTSRGGRKLVVEEMLPAAWAKWEALRYAFPQGWPIFCDVFCEDGAFDLAQSRRILEAAKRLGFRLKIHVDEFAPLGGTPLAVELGAASADHLVTTPADHITRLAGSATIGVALPGTPFGLAHRDYSPGRALIDALRELGPDDFTVENERMGDRFWHLYGQEENK